MVGLDQPYDIPWGEPRAQRSGKDRESPYYLAVIVIPYD